jgi:outer membrane protein assembly factor BamB
LYAIERGSDNPEGRWRFSTGGPVIGMPVATETHVFVASRSGNVFAIRPDDGEIVWRIKIDSEIQAGPVVTEEWLYFGGTDGSIYALNSG